MKETTEDIRIKVETEVKIDNLQTRITSLERTVNFLTILCNEYAKRNGIKVERFPNGVVVIS